MEIIFKEIPDEKPREEPREITKEEADKTQLEWEEDAKNEIAKLQKIMDKEEKLKKEKSKP